MGDESGDEGGKINWALLLRAILALVSLSVIAWALYVAFFRGRA